jgi:hypothetical protein
MVVRSVVNKKNTGVKICSGEVKINRGGEEIPAK